MKILAVDDDPIIRELLSEALRVIGFTTVSFAVSGQDALQVVEEADTPFDCFLLDVQMPNMDGITLVSHLRKMADYGRTPVLMITAMSDRSYVDSAFQAGATDYINKPFDIAELHARLKLIEELVIERKLLQDRNTIEPVSDKNSLMVAANIEERLHIDDVDGVIDYLALENYILQMSRTSLFGNCVFGVVIKDAARMFEGASTYEFRYAITDVAEAISDCLKPHLFFVSHVGGGEFACIRDSGRQFDRVQFAGNVALKLHDMDLYNCDGRPMLINLSVSDPIQLDLKSARNCVQALLQSVANAEQSSLSTEEFSVEPARGLKSLFGQ